MADQMSVFVPRATISKVIEAVLSWPLNNRSSVKSVNKKRATGVRNIRTDRTLLDRMSSKITLSSPNPPKNDCII